MVVLCSSVFGGMHSEEGSRDTEGEVLEVAEAERLGKVRLSMELVELAKTPSEEDWPGVYAGAVAVCMVPEAPAATSLLV